MNDEGEHTVARWLGTQAYAVTATAMRDWTSGRRPNTFDELWFLEHPKTYTLGRAGKREHVTGDIGEIPLVESDRGGQVTYHGPGQLIAYTMVDVSRLGASVRTMVQGLEQAVIEQLRALNIDAHRIEGAPGVYVSDAKIAALGLRVSRGRAFHGLSLNVDLDLSPFCAINPEVQVDPAGPALPSMETEGWNTTRTADQRHRHRLFRQRHGVWRCRR